MNIFWSEVYINPLRVTVFQQLEYTKNTPFPVYREVDINKLEMHEKLANLISKLNFYKLIPYPMDNKLISTQDSCKYIYFNNWLQNVPTHYRLNSLVQLLQQLVTVYRQGTGYTALYTCFQNWCQSVLTGTDYTALYTCLNNWLQSVPAGTCYTALYTCFNNCLQSVPAGTCYTALYTCFNNWLQSGYTALYTCFNLPVTSLQTGCWLHSPYCTGLHPNWLQKKKKKKKAG